MTVIEIPQDDAFISNLILQRSGPFTRIGGLGALRKWFSTGEKSQLVGFLRENQLVEKYLKETFKECAEEVRDIVRELPGDSFDRMISIGPGNGVLELLFCREVKPTKVLLIDIEESDMHQAGFQDQGSGYASLRATKDFLVSNGVPPDVVMTCNPSHQALPSFKFDFLMSILSMGFHYPCDQYSEFIVENANKDARIVMDKRGGSTDAGFEKLRKIMRTQKQIPMDKGDRFFLSHPDGS
jgi:hypothetical protein